MSEGVIQTNGIIYFFYGKYKNMGIKIGGEKKYEIIGILNMYIMVGTG